MKTGAELIADERKRQIEIEGWTPEHDADHPSMTLAVAGASYVLGIASICTCEHKSWKETYKRFSDNTWPFDREWFKPTPDDPVRQLVKAGSLIAAEIDRLQEAEKAAGKTE